MLPLFILIRIITQFDMDVTKTIKSISVRPFGCSVQAGNRWFPVCSNRYPENISHNWKLLWQLTNDRSLVSDSCDLHIQLFEGDKIFQSEILNSFVVFHYLHI